MIVSCERGQRRDFYDSSPYNFYSRTATTGQRENHIKRSEIFEINNKTIKSIAPNIFKLQEENLGILRSRILLRGLSLTCRLAAIDWLEPADSQGKSWRNPDRGKMKPSSADWRNYRLFF